MISSRERARHCVVAALGLALSLGSTVLFAQDAGVWPARTIQIVVPYTPGTGADILSRILGPKLAERWKIGVVTDNRAGASGNIGTDFVAKSAPDGYTLLCTATSFGTNPAINQKLPFDPVKSFAPVILLATSTMAVIRAERSQAFSDVPTLKELGLAELEVETWYGVFAPAGTPQAVIARVNAEMNVLLKQSEIRELLAKQGMAPAGGTPERFGDLVKKELARWSRVVAAAGIKAD